MSQPVEESYPNPITQQPQDSNSSHSNGSFGPVFVVLAVIVVISAVACVLGRLSSKGRKRVKEVHHHPKASNKQSHGLGPKEWESRQKTSFNMGDHGDIEFGFEKPKPSSKNGGGGGGAKAKQPHHKPAQVRFADNRV